MIPLKKIVIFSDGSTNFEIKNKFGVTKNKSKFLTTDKASLARLRELEKRSSVYQLSSKKYKNKYTF